MPHIYNLPPPTLEDIHNPPTPKLHQKCVENKIRSSFSPCILLKSLFELSFTWLCCIAPHFHIKPTVDNPEGHKLEQRGHKPGHLHHVCMLRLHCVVIEGI
jgi:hypothetical protein